MGIISALLGILTGFLAFKAVIASDKIATTEPFNENDELHHTRNRSIILMILVGILWSTLLYWIPA